MTAAKMINVDTALSLLREAAPVPQVETLPIADCAGRILQQTITAPHDQPPFRASAMDGYAIRFEDLTHFDSFTIIGESAAGNRYTGTVQAGEAVRIFTGAVVPDGATHIIIQEDVSRTDNRITVMDDQLEPRNIRRQGIDFDSGMTLVEQNTLLSPGMVALIAAANYGTIQVAKRPTVAILSTGDELVEPGSPLAQDQIINSNATALIQLIQQWGGTPIYNGIARDTVTDVQRKIRQMQPADIIVPIGGASVGDYDIVKKALYDIGLKTIFEKIAVKPGKPTWFGSLEESLVLGLPGNPASALVCAHLFLRPLMAKMSGTVTLLERQHGFLQNAVAANGPRENYLRAKHWTEKGLVKVKVLQNQDSSLLLPFREATCLIQCPPNSSTRDPGALVAFVPLT